MFTKDTSVKVDIETTLGEVKHRSKFTLAESTELERLMVIQNIFQVMGVDNSLTDMIEDYRKVGEAYESFFREVDPIEQESTRILPLKTVNSGGNGKFNVFAEKLSEQLQQADKSTESVQPKYSRYRMAKEYEKAMNSKKTATSEPEKKREEPAHYRTGIIENPNGNKYQLRLICLNEQCNSRKTYYVTLGTTDVICKDCGKSHHVRQAKDDYMKPDANNNFFIAGKFVGEDEK